MNYVKWLFTVMICVSLVACGGADREYKKKKEMLVELRGKLAKQVTKINAQKWEYKKSIKKLLKEIGQEKQRYNISSLSHATERIKYDMRLIQKYDAYNRKLSQILTATNAGLEEAVFMERNLDADHSMRRIVGDSKGLVKDIDNLLRKYNPYTEELPVDIGNLKMRPLEEIWKEAEAISKKEREFQSQRKPKTPKKSSRKEVVKVSPKPKAKSSSVKKRTNPSDMERLRNSFFGVVDKSVNEVSNNAKKVVTLPVKMMADSFENLDRSLGNNSQDFYSERQIRLIQQKLKEAEQEKERIRMRNQRSLDNRRNLRVQNRSIGFPNNGHLNPREIYEMQNNLGTSNNSFSGNGFEVRMFNSGNNHSGTIQMYGNATIEDLCEFVGINPGVEQVLRQHRIRCN